MTKTVEYALETTATDLFTAFAFKTEQLIARQPFEQPLELDAFQIWDSPLGQDIVSLTYSHFCGAFSIDKRPVARETVASIAREYADSLRAEIHKPVDFDAIFYSLSEERQAYWKEKCQQVQAAGQLGQILEGFCLFLENVAIQTDMTTSDLPLGRAERELIVLYLMQLWFLATTLIMVASCGGEDRLRLRSFQRVEYEAVVEYTMGKYGWDSDSNKAIKLLQNSLGPKLMSKGLKIPGTRYKGYESLDEPHDEPHNDERQVLMIGLFMGLEWTGKRNLLEILPDVPSGKLLNSLAKVAKNNLINAIRDANNQLGIEVPPYWVHEGKTEDEIRQHQKEDIVNLAPKEVPDYKVVASDGSTTSSLEQAADKAAFSRWRDGENEEREQDRKAVLAEDIGLLISEAHLTPRLRLMAKLFHKDDSTITDSLEKTFNKPVKPGAVRALRHRLLVKLREEASKK